MGSIKLLYVAPERLISDGMLRELQGLPLSFFAIDEAHCVSQWGHDFRPHYRELHRLKAAFKGIGIHAFTATATEHVRDDVVQQLRLENPTVLVGNFDRPNLIYRVERKRDLISQVQEVIARHPHESRDHLRHHPQRGRAHRWNTHRPGTRPGLIMLASPTMSGRAIKRRSSKIGCRRSSPRSHSAWGSTNPMCGMSSMPGPRSRSSTISRRAAARVAMDWKPSAACFSAETTSSPGSVSSRINPRRSTSVAGVAAECQPILRRTSLPTSSACRPLWTEPHRRLRNLLRHLPRRETAGGRCVVIAQKILSSIFRQNQRFGQSTRLSY